MDDETERQILDEATGAHTASRRILALMEGEEDGDPIVLIIRLLTEIRETQRAMVLKLSTLETRLRNLEEPHD